MLAEGCVSLNEKTEAFGFEFKSKSNEEVEETTA
jgi:hypothetical protein